MSDADLLGPLKQFQNTAASDREAVRALVQSINKTQSDPLDNDTVNTLFDAHWSELEDAITTAPPSVPAEPEQKRTQDEIMEEVLVTVRALQRDVANLTAERRAAPLAVQAPQQDAAPPILVWSAARRRDDGDLDNRALSNRDLIVLLLESTGGAFTVQMGRDSADVELSDDTPALSADLLHDLRGLAASQNLVVTVRRPDGTGVRYDPDGTEWRRAGKDANFVLQSAPTGDAL